MSEVEAFALEAEELKFVASQFRHIHSRQVQHTFRFYSQQWRTWAAIYIQAAWRKHLRRRRRKEEEEYYESDYPGREVMILQGRWFRVLKVRQNLDLIQQSMLLGLLLIFVVIDFEYQVQESW
jgi:hypothetical protein